MSVILNPGAGMPNVPTDALSVTSMSAANLPAVLATPGGWTQTFLDQFTVTHHNADGSQIDPTHWGAFYGVPGGSNQPGYWLPSHLTVHDGILDIVMYAQTISGKRKWVSGACSRSATFAGAYGAAGYRMQWASRASTIDGASCIGLIWPRSDFGWDFEIDAFETDPTGNRCDSASMTLHWGNRSKPQSQIVYPNSGQAPLNFADWHVFDFTWTPPATNGATGTSTLVIDGSSTYTYTISSINVPPGTLGKACPMRFDFEMQMIQNTPVPLLRKPPAPVGHFQIAWYKELVHN